MLIEFRNHIAQARHPITNEPLFDENRKPVPLFPDERSIWLDGSMIGFVGSPPKRGLMFIRPRSQLTEYVINQVLQEAIVQFGMTPKVKCVPEVPEHLQQSDEDSD